MAVFQLTQEANVLLRTGCFVDPLMRSGHSGNSGYIAAVLHQLPTRIASSLVVASTHPTVGRTKTLPARFTSVSFAPGSQQLQFLQLRRKEAHVSATARAEALLPKAGSNAIHLEEKPVTLFFFSAVSANGGR